METFQNTRESFTDEEDVPNIQIPVTTNTSTTSSMESVDHNSLHKIHSPPSHHPSQRQLSFSVENILAPGRFGHPPFSAHHHSFDDGK